MFVSNIFHLNIRIQHMFALIVFYFAFDTYIVRRCFTMIFFGNISNIAFSLQAQRLVSCSSHALFFAYTVSDRSWLSLTLSPPLCITYVFKLSYESPDIPASPALEVLGAAVSAFAWYMRSRGGLPEKSRLSKGGRWGDTCRVVEATSRHQHQHHHHHRHRRSWAIPPTTQPTSFRSPCFPQVKMKQFIPLPWRGQRKSDTVYTVFFVLKGLCIQQSEVGRCRGIHIYADGKTTKDRTQMAKEDDSAEKFRVHTSRLASF